MKKLIYLIFLFPFFSFGQSTVLTNSNHVTVTNKTMDYNSNTFLNFPYFDTTTRASFSIGGTNAGDTASFTTSTKQAFFWDKSDTLVITKLKFGTAGSNDTLGVYIYFNDSLFVTSGATKVVNTATAMNATTSQYTGLSVTSFDNAKIPPGSWIWIELPTVISGRKPTFMSLSIIGTFSRTVYL